MRLALLLLLLANLALLAWSRYGASPSAPDVPLVREVNPEKLKLVPPDDAPLAPPARRPEPAAALSTVALASGCMEWGAFAPPEARRAEKALAPLALGERLVQRRTEELAHWWVYMPPQGSRQAALRKSAELKALGVDDYFIIAEEGEWRWALSLGIFRSAESAQSRLAALRARGIDTAVVAPRETILPKLWLRVEGTDPTLQAHLGELARTMAGSELRPCP